MVVKTKVIGHSKPRDSINGISPDQMMSNVEKNLLTFEQAATLDWSTLSEFSVGVVERYCIFRFKASAE